MPTDNPQEKTLGLVAHLLGAFTGWLGPLILWLVKKEQGGFAVQEARTALNFQITVFAAYIAVVIVTIVVGFISVTLAGLVSLLYLLIWLGGLVFSIINALKANKGEDGKYPYSLNLIK
ncbi:MAG: DUF4870 domain-containing protein [Verrucomicrobiales bacterium]|jgi:uncharacterized Tic20 family protein|nr:DUF4870 domain-containing protein [Verrucomicrobiales bacterium]